MRVYLDTSALVKLVQREDETPALRTWLEAVRDDGATPVSSALARVELLRAVQGGGAGALSKADRLLGRLALVALDDALLDTAGRLAPRIRLRSLDAVHLASAMQVAPVTALVTYDDRMAAVARDLLLSVASPR